MIALAPTNSRFSLFFLTCFHCASLATGNLYHIPGAAPSSSSSSQDTDVNRELYEVCSFAEDDQEEDVMEQVENGADIDWISPEEGTTCLFSAVMRGKLQVVETVLDLGADGSIPRVEDGLTPVFAAAYYGRDLELAALQAHGYLSDVHQSHHGVPLLHWSCQGFATPHQRTVTYLVEQGADINQRDWLGRTCLDKAVTNKLRFHIEDLGGIAGSDL